MDRDSFLQGLRVGLLLGRPEKWDYGKSLCLVTFRNKSGSSVMYRRFCFSGNSCYYLRRDYWSATPGGSADPTILDHVTGNLTVYAIADYLPLEYIEGTGTQYINTGYEVKESSRFVLDAMITAESVSSGTARQLFQVQRYNAWTGYGAYLSYQAGGVELRGKWNSGAVTVGYVGAMIGRIAQISLDSSRITMSDDAGHSVSAAFSNAWSAIGKPMYLFTANYDTGGVDTTNIGRFRCYRFRIFEGDTLVHDFFPAEDGDGVACMYDIVTRQYKYNAGTGEFLKP